MTKVKMCGLTRAEDILAANELRPDYIGFVFFSKSKRYIDPKQASALRELLSKDIKAVGVFVDEDIDKVAGLVYDNIIDIPQLHGSESDEYIRTLQRLTGKPVIRAFRIRSQQDAINALDSPADMILLDAGAGDGRAFDWSLIEKTDRPYFLAGGLAPDNAAEAISRLHPYALDVSSGIETDGHKDKNKMAAFMDAVRKEDKYD